MERLNGPIREAAHRPATEPSTQANHTATALPSLVVDSLYIPDAKIVSFAVSESHPRITNDEYPGVLSQTSSEWIIAVGPLHMYRALESVAFLSCGSALHPILPRSQCWCIDQANSKFVLQIRRPIYWRIELPVSSAEESRRARHFRNILDGVLRLGKTQCHFKWPSNSPISERRRPPSGRKAWMPACADAMEEKGDIDGSYASAASNTPEACSCKRWCILPARHRCSSGAGLGNCERLGQDAPEAQLSHEKHGAMAAVAVPTESDCSSRGLPERTLPYCFLSPDDEFSPEHRGTQPSSVWSVPSVAASLQRRISHLLVTLPPVNLTIATVPVHERQPLDDTPFDGFSFPIWNHNGTAAVQTFSNCLTKFPGAQITAASRGNGLCQVMSNSDVKDDWGTATGPQTRIWGVKQYLDSFVPDADTGESTRAWVRRTLIRGSGT